MLVQYLKNRLCERTTWLGIVLAITGGAALSSPYSWLAIAAGAVAAILPGPGE